MLRDVTDGSDGIMLRASTSGKADTMERQQIQQRIAENWAQVLGEVRDASKRSGRESDSVQVIGVTKYVDADWTADLFEAGCKNLGENRPQVLWSKADSPGFPCEVRWHMIGHLQTNKVRRLLRYEPLIHSVDSERLLHLIAAESLKAAVTTKILLEVNISGDESKTGMPALEVDRLLQQGPIDGVEVMGLMAMTGLGADQETAQRQFDRVRELRDQLSLSSGLPLRELSMGMSGDFVEAISSGATMVRIGSRLFDGLLS